MVPGDDRVGDPPAATADALYALMVALVRQQPRDLSRTALSTLFTVFRTGPRRVTDLAVLEAVAQPSMTALVGTLERAGLIERRPDPDDQRVVLVAATAEGAAYIRDRSRMWAETLRGLIEKLVTHELESLVAATPALLHLLELYDEHHDNGDRSGPAPGRRPSAPPEYGSIATP